MRRQTPRECGYANAALDSKDSSASSAVRGPETRTADRMRVGAFVPPALVFNSSGTIIRLTNFRLSYVALEVTGPAIRLWGQALLAAMAN